MAIYGYELHVKTVKSIGEIVDYLKAKGFHTDLELCKDEEHLLLEVKHPQNQKSYEFKVKLYDEEGELKHYEIFTHGKDRLGFLEELFKDI